MTQATKLEFFSEFSQMMQSIVYHMIKNSMHQVKDMLNKEGEDISNQ